MNYRFNGNRIQYIEDEIDNIRGIVKYENDYANSIKKCTELYEILKENDEQFYFWFCDYERGFCYKKLGMIDKSIKFIEKSMLYKVAPDDHNKTVWLLAVDYAEVGKKKEAIKMYLECAKYYKNIKESRLRISLLFNIAKEQYNPNRMIKMMNMLICDGNFTYKRLSQIEVGKVELFLSGSQEIIKYCLQNQCTNYIFLFLNSIKNKELRTQVEDMIKKLECF